VSSLSFQNSSKGLEKRVEESFQAEKVFKKG
jgi:hypothetical protein